MEKDFEKYLNYVIECTGNAVTLTQEHLLTNIVINIRRLILQLEELEKNVLNNSCNNTFAALILGTNLENMKRELENFKQDYMKR